MINGKKKAPDMRMMLFDEGVPLALRRRLLVGLCTDESEKSTEILTAFLNSAAAKSGEDVYQERNRRLADLLREMQEGPLRDAVYIDMISRNGGPARAHVVLEDGASAFAVVPDAELASSLRRGETVLLEGQGRAILGRPPALEPSGEEARLERILGGDRVEVTLNDQGHYVLRASAALGSKLRAGEVSVGSTLIVCPRRRMAFDALPPQDGPTHYRFVARVPVPDVVVARDLGAPPAYIDELIELVRMEMLEPERPRRFRVRSSVMKLLTGVSGSGKTYSIMALWRRLYEVMSEVSGIPIDQLPPRVLRLRAAQVLSKWLGDSDKNLDRFFDEAEQLAAEPIVTQDGRKVRAPVLAVLEEVDGVARARGEDAIYDRIFTTALQRLDPSRPELRDKLILFIATTNVPHQVDFAFLRRAGGTIERFGRLDRRSFALVLQKHISGRPLAMNGTDPALAERKMVAGVTDWLFSPNGADPGLVEFTFVGSPTPCVRYRRDFLTASVVDLAVQQASWEACLAEGRGTEHPGISREQLLSAFDRQIRSIVDQLQPGNAAHYVDLPEGVRVAGVRRREQPTLMPFLLERVN